MKKILPALLLFVQIAHAQQYYRFEEKTGSYEALPLTLPAGNVILAPDFDNDKLTPVNLDGKTFNFFGYSFTFGGTIMLNVQTFGNLRIDNDTSILIIDGIFTDLDSIDGNTSITWQLTGDPGKHIFKSQWKNVAISNGPAGNYLNFQIWLYQESGIIELHYGESSANNASGYTTTTGPYAGIFYSDNGFGQMYGKTWLYGDPSMISIDSNSQFTFPRLHGIPANGTIWRFIPKSYVDPGTSVEEFSGTAPKFYPNPVKDEMFIELNLPQTTEVDLFDETGRSAGKIKVENNRAEVAHLSPGIYYLSIDTPKGGQRLRFVKADY